MGTTWYDVSFGGATIGFACYNTASDTWRTAIVPLEAISAGDRYWALPRRCEHQDDRGRFGVGVALHWVNLAIREAHRRPIEMLACLQSAVRLAIDVCVSRSAELELWRAGYRVPVRAMEGEPDQAWLGRARSAGCDAVLTRDRGAAREACRLGMASVLLPYGTGSAEMTAEILDAMEQLEDRRPAVPRMARILAPLAAVGLVVALLASCAPRPRAVEPAPAVTPWCFAATARWDGRDQAAGGCFETAGLCARAHAIATRWGGMAKVSSLGECRRAP